MRINLPLCDFQNCRYASDGNCMVKSKYDFCKYRRVESEAIKEFAEKLKKKTYPFPCAIGVENAVTIRAIDDLVNEMVGEDDGCP